MSDKAVVNLATGAAESPDRTIVAFLMATAAQGAGKKTVVFLTVDAVRLGLVGGADGVAIPGVSPLTDLMAQFADAGGELFVCPPCFNNRELDPAALLPNAALKGGAALWEYIGDGATVLSY